MIINHNMPSINTNRQLGINNFNTAKSLEKLSSGLRINKAGDDAAGLAISEKMRGQIRGLDQAARNSQDGISLINTAEGSLSETHSILQRMRELATQAANDTNVNADRTEIQKEINQLSSEINRIGNTTEYNTQKLLNGGGTAVTVNTTTAGVTPGTPLAANGAVSNVVNVASRLTGTGAVSNVQANQVAGYNTLTINTPLALGETLIIGGQTITAYADAAAKGGDAFGITLDTQGTAALQATAIAAMTFTDLTTSNPSAGVVKFTQTVAGTGNIDVATGTGATSVSSVKTAAIGRSDTLTITSALTAGDTLSFGGQTITAYKDAAAIAAVGGDPYGINLATASTSTLQATAITAMFASDGTYTATNPSAGAVKLERKIVDATPVAVGTVTPASAVQGSTSFVLSKALTAGETLDVAGKTITTYTDAAARTAAGNTAYGILATDSAIAQATEIRAMTFTGVTTGGGAGTANLSFTQTVAGTGDVTAPLVTGAPGTGSAGEYNFEVTAQKAGDVMTIDGQALTFRTSGNAAQSAIELKTLISANTTLDAKYTVSGTDTNVILTQKSGSYSSTAPTVKQGDTSNGYSATLQIGANTSQGITLNFADMRARALGITGSAGSEKVTAKNGSVATLVSAASVSDGTTNTSTEFSLDVSTNKKATAAISIIDDAIEAVSAERSKMGAYTNRLEHTITNLGTSSENLTAAESRVRDVDMAKEMMSFQKNNILSQAAQAMLAQANQQPQGVLQLLR